MMTPMAMPPETVSRDGVTLRLEELVEPGPPIDVPALRYRIEVAGQAVGELRVRLGDTEDLQRHFGQIGYEVYPAFRGRGHATTACRLGLAVMHDLGYGEIWITCNPENKASRRVCEKVGGVLTETVDIPAGHVMYQHGIRQKCRYRVSV
ncbi:GNAT family N-acetyltransferase [Maricaulis sp.]|uniref:GNAT family N-acetyltransferase n=1 Tax=Maricaulis sp. TaxID=1486257 RepID=UPI003A95AF87